MGCDYVKRIKGRVKLEFEVGVELLCTWTKLYLDGKVGDVEVLKDQWCRPKKKINGVDD